MARCRVNNSGLYHVRHRFVGDKMFAGFRNFQIFFEEFSGILKQLNTFYENR